MSNVPISSWPQRVQADNGRAYVLKSSGYAYGLLTLHKTMVFLFSALGSFATLVSFAFPFPNFPFSTDGRWIRDSTGATFTYIGVNWPGAADTMLPEGLQYQSVQTIVGKIKNSGFNSIRLTFAIELIDQIFENGGQDVLISTAFVSALGQENGTKIFDQVLANNPSFNEATTRLQV